MLSRNLKFGIISNPLLESPFVQHFEESVISPGNSKFISTENLITITTEDGVGLVTEG